MRIHRYHVDREGALFFEGCRLNDPWTLRFFLRNMDVDEQGRYVVVCDGEYCYIEAEDTPYVVVDLDVKTSGSGSVEGIELLFAGSYKERLDPYTLFVDHGNIPYCMVRKGRFPARFNRKSYYHLASYVDFDESKGLFWITVGGRDFTIRMDGVAAVSQCV